MAVSLKDVRTQLTQIKSYMTTATAKEYIRTQGTCNDTLKLEGQRLEHYRCNSNCSWSSSGR